MFNRKPKPTPEPKQKPTRAAKQVRHLMPPIEQPEGAYAADHQIKRGGLHGYQISQEAAYFAEDMFIGYQLCSLIAKHWLVDKACAQPAKEALRFGWDLKGDKAHVAIHGRQDKKQDIALHLRDCIRYGRAFGGQLVLFDVRSDNPAEWYENPLNVDGIQAGMYRGIILIDPIDAAPILTAENMQDPASPRYMKPTYWLIGGRKYHYSHFMSFVPYPVTKPLRHRYNYFGVSVPERVYKRVHHADCVANEAAPLAKTKRLTVMGIAGLDDADQDVIEGNLQWLTQLRDNFGVLVGDSETKVTQLDTALADLDETIMTQYQLVAAAAQVPATKLLETTPKGFNATGEYEAESYRQTLESIQENDLQPILEKHYELQAKSLGITAPEVAWQPLDSPTSDEVADIELKQAQAAQIYANAGAIDGYMLHQKLTSDPESPYYGLQQLDDDYEAIEETPSLGE